MPFVSPFSRAICPTCGHRFHLSEARWRDYSAASRQPCTEMRDALGLSVTPSVPPEVPPPAGFLRRLHVPRNLKKLKKICPNCRVDLPQYLADGGAGERIAIVGEGSTGKSQLIWAWIDRLQSLPPKLGVTVRPEDTYDLDKFEPADSDDLWLRRYDSHLNPKPDGSGRVADRKIIPKDIVRSLRPPLIFRLVFSQRPIWHRIIKPFADFRPVDLLFYDTAGENFKTRKEMQSFAGYVLSATGLIFLVDPLSCEELKALLAATPTSVASEGKPSGLMGRIRKAFEEDQVYDDSRLLPLPTAIVLTKSDLLRDRFEQDNPHGAASHHSDYRNGFPAAEIAAVSRDIREYLSRASQGGLLGLAEGNFRNHHFFACSALGREPDLDQKLDGPPEPFRVLDPIFWLLFEKGHIRPAPLPPALTAPLPPELTEESS